MANTEITNEVLKGKTREEISRRLEQLGLAKLDADTYGISDRRETLIRETSELVKILTGLESLPADTVPEHSHSGGSHYGEATPI